MLGAAIRAWLGLLPGTALGIALGFSLGLLPALASNVSRDDPPPNTRGRSAGSRGCGASAATDSPRSEDTPALVLLAPEGVGKTSSVQPTFAWFSRDANPSVTFRLYEHDDASQTYRLLTETPSTVTQAGILTLSLSGEPIALELGQSYLWQVELVCDRSRPSGNLFAEAEFEVVEPTSTLTERLATAASHAEQAALYAAADLWYDALHITLTVDASSTMAPLRSELFSRVTINETEQAQFEESSVHQME